RSGRALEGASAADGRRGAGRAALPARALRQPPARRAEPVAAGDRARGHRAFRLEARPLVPDEAARGEPARRPGQGHGQGVAVRRGGARGLAGGAHRSDPEHARESGAVFRCASRGLLRQREGGIQPMRERARRSVRTAGAALLALGAAAATTRVARSSDPGGGDWPMWGGTPDRNMVSSMKGLPTTWDVAAKKNVKWVAALGSQAYGNPVVARGLVFAGTNNEA